ncbi:MAG: AmmeMemoRadiSam system protein A [Patescibacteria group bacterium]
MSIIKLAKEAVQHYVKTGNKINPDDLSIDLKKKKAGVFVTLKNNGNLRGCIGTIKPTKDTLAQEIISSAIGACQDPRIPDIKEEELSNLTYEVNILKKPTLVTEVEGSKIPTDIKINPKREGVIVESGLKKGLLLPNLEGIDNTKKQIKTALKKARINPEENYKIYKFETETYEGM